MQPSSWSGREHHGPDRLIWPCAEEFGFADEMDAFGLQFGHGVGVGLHERPIITRLNSLDTPVEIKEGMVFALETYAPAADGRSAARSRKKSLSPRWLQGHNPVPMRGADGGECQLILATTTPSGNRACPSRWMRRWRWRRSTWTAVSGCTASCTN